MTTASTTGIAQATATAAATTAKGGLTPPPGRVVRIPPMWPRCQWREC